MDYVNICQLCIFCKKGSHVFKVDLNCFDDQTGKVIIDPIKRIHYNFQCEFCKKKMQQLVEQLTSMAFEQ